MQLSTRSVMEHDSVDVVCGHPGGNVLWQIELSLRLGVVAQVTHCAE